MWWHELLPAGLILKIASHSQFKARVCQANEIHQKHGIAGGPQRVWHSRCPFLEGMQISEREQ
jgi:hypothetical protein